MSEGGVTVSPNSLGFSCRSLNRSGPVSSLKGRVFQFSDVDPEIQRFADTRDPVSRTDEPISPRNRRSEPRQLELES